jgi:adenylate kinase
MKLVLIGIQGSGKSTQGNLLSKQLNIPYLSTGHIFRNIAKEKTDLGKKVKLLMSAGHLIPDALTVEIVGTYLSRPEYGKGYILDGFPRTIAQAEEFANNVDHVVHIQIPDKEALWRLAYRNEQRDDDTIDAIKKRIEIFKSATLPVLDFYAEKNILDIVDGTQEIEEVNQSILKSIGKQLVENRIKNWSRDSKTILAIVGMPGSGKTEVSQYLSSKSFPVVSFSSIVNEMIDNKGLKHTQDNHREIRTNLRKEHGMGALAKLSAPKIEKGLHEKSHYLIIEGMRSWEEYLYLKEEYKDIRIIILAVYADKKIRYQRIKNRKTRSLLFGEQRDIEELIELNMGPTIAFADYLITNNRSKEELYKKIDDILQIIYFS